MSVDYYYTAKDVAEVYGVSLSTSRRLIKKIKEYYQVDEERILKKGLIPKDLVQDYLNISVPSNVDKGDEHEDSH